MFSAVSSTSLIALNMVFAVRAGKDRSLRTLAVYCYSSTAVNWTVHKFCCLCILPFYLCSYISLNVFSVWTCRTVPEVPVVERAVPGAFLVGVVDRCQAPSCQLFYFFFQPLNFAWVAFFFLSTSFDPVWLTPTPTHQTSGECTSHNLPLPCTFTGF